jgi:hypothetical protein
MGALVAVKVPLTESYSSAVFRMSAPFVHPPAISTFPLSSSVAVWDTRAEIMGALVAVNVPVVGSKISAVLKMFELIDPLPPPAISTLPSGSRVAVWKARAEVMVALIGVNFWGTGS